MVKDNDVNEAREAHRRKLAAPRREARSKDPDSVTLRKHRLAHRNNVVQDEEQGKRAVPGPVPFKNQLPLSMGEGEGSNE